MANDVLQTVRTVMERWEIPEWIWRPIAWQESRLNPRAVAISEKEHSIGLFQINIKAHPEFAGLNLTDPAVNAEIAARYFLAPAWQKVKDWTDPGHQALYVWQTGIRPSSEAITARGTELMQMARELAPPAAIKEPDQTMPKQQKTWWQRIWGAYEERLRKIDEEIGITWPEPSESEPAEPPLAWYERLMAGGLAGVIWIVLLLTGLAALWFIFKPEGTPTVPFQIRKG